MVALVDWDACRQKERARVLQACSDFLRKRGIPCGVWEVPPPGKIEAAQAAFDEELERIIEDMMRDVPRMADELHRQE